MLKYKISAGKSQFRGHYSAYEGFWDRSMKPDISSLNFEEGT